MGHGDSVLISIKPQWCELIASGKKTIEARKTRPKLETPFKCYIYCTKQKAKHALHTYVTESSFRNEYGITNHWRSGEDIVDVNSNLPAYRHNDYLAEGRVIGEFVCDCIPAMQNVITGEWFLDTLTAACLTPSELDAYSGGKTLYGWHISALQIYDKPRELSEFKQCDKCPYGPIERCKEHEFSCDGTYALSRPPQSWCYVEELT